MPSGAREVCGSSPSRVASSLVGTFRMSWPSSTTLPAVKGSTRAIARSRVDLPQALGPITAVYDPRRICRSTLSQITRRS